MFSREFSTGERPNRRDDFEAGVPDTPRVTVDVARRTTAANDGLTDDREAALLAAAARLRDQTQRRKMNAYGLLTVAGGNSDSVSEGHPTSSRVTVDVAHWRTAVNDPRIDIKPTDDREAVVREMIDSIPQSPEFLAAAARLRKLTMQGRQMRDLRSSMEVVGQSDSVSEDQSRQVAVAEQARVRDIAPSPLSSQALRFEIQTREEQLKSTADTAKRVLLQSQLEAYRRLLRESEEGANREEKISLSNASLRTVVSGAWRRFKNWFKK